ncbi:ABL076Wp [Eremothecium gossypii ATCC 10895]|uniref:Altered inheritance of mitochondria protein 18, mitochondrial n=1 Tax=Eremothecium gossypii (strain ATCC 10895 / CBS 109.51 / FGSC 9923 / NRRL Y-1056) TaxID=284811 RepID=AIM18_EREGS|nr:ABL076Wp [Eremothecium gossypii ATCC 10895]Q75DU9.1 RecName: Full=Altered inheritance of mitochondria protein 18, mitochondrial; Flags: Precursor [Eremothecium gossypii ATCC 10895]AAS50695.1 ABL076Wp [Eremothecium gossypii ATCC 10895]AEY94983.1 FABL076Wp [Eremothecium gossypii FDAG1]
MLNKRISNLATILRFIALPRARNIIAPQEYIANSVPVAITRRAARNTFVFSVALTPFVLYSAFHNDSAESDFPELVEVYPGVRPFPAVLGPPELPLQTNYKLLGHGVRAVTFLSFKVYALGIYAAVDDLPLIPRTLSAEYLSTLDTEKVDAPAKEQLYKAMQDHEKSRAVVNDLLGKGLRLVAKITPIRNTDFTHLKDGLVKSILNHPAARHEGETLANGLEELRAAFTRRGSVPKDDDLVLELQATGALQLYHRDAKTGQTTTLGKVTEPLIGRYLFSQYLSGKAPLSKDTKDSVTRKIISMV